MVSTFYFLIIIFFLADCLIPIPYQNLDVLENWLIVVFDWIFLIYLLLFLFPLFFGGFWGVLIY